MIEKYKEEYENINVPTDLKTKTLLLMKEEEEKKKRFRKKPILVFATSFGVLMLVLFNVLQEKPLLETNLEVGKTATQVKLKEGSLTFEKMEEQSRKFGRNEGLTVTTIGKQEAQRLSEKTIEPVALKQYELSKKRYLAYYQNETLKSVEWLYDYENEDKEVKLRYETPYKEISTNSTIENKELAIYYDNEDGEVYDAYFNYDGGVIQVNSQNVSQEEFIKIVVEVIHYFK